MSDDTIRETPSEEDVLTPEAKEAEENALKPSSEDEIRDEVIEKYGLDPDEHEDIINKFVADKLEERKNLSTAIKQKIRQRERADALAAEKAKLEGLGNAGKVEPQKPGTSNPDYVTKDELIDFKLDAKGVSEELRKKVKAYAKLENISVDEALASDYVKFLQDTAKREQETEAAGIGGKRGAPASVKIDPNKPFEGDLETPEGRKAFDKWKELQKEAGI